VDLPASILPRLLPAGALAGRVTTAAARATGLLDGTPVFTGGADTQCGLLGSGVVEPEQVGAVIGTTGPVQIVLDRPTFDDTRQRWVGAHVVPGRWVLESNAGDTGKAYLWLLDLMGLKPETALDYARLDQQAKEADPEAPVFAFVGPSIFDLRALNPSRAAGLLFPYPFGRRRPGRAEMVRGFLESVAFAIRANLEQLEEATGRRIAELTLGGGMAESKLLVDLVSEVCGIPLRVARVTETAALGCALLGGTGMGVYPDLVTAARATVRHQEVPAAPPGPARERYRLWRELFTTLNAATVV
ncbi:MAG: FGGY-family carbohydrate kinase, partial [Candidatus Binatia bacterium]